MTKAVFSLKAVYEPFNVKRYYTVRVGQNLFREWEVYTSYGRIGFSGHSKLYTFASLAEALPKLKEVLQKRFSAAKKIGTPYSLQEISMEDSFKFLFLRITLWVKFLEVNLGLVKSYRALILSKESNL